jgi:hypothetical protein
MTKLVRRISVFLLAVAIAAPASAGLLVKLKGPETGQIDITNWLLKGGGFLPVPIIVTEPAVGFGLGTAPTFFLDFNHPGTKQKDLSVEEFPEYPPSDSVAQIETEARWDFKGPWSLVDFLGYGQTWSDVPVLDSDDLILAGGAGFRVNIAPKLNFRTGIDIARGPEEWTIYLQFGHAWGI